MKILFLIIAIDTLATASEFPLATANRIADAIWIAMLGAGVPALGEVSADQQLWQNQIAATVAGLLGVTPDLPRMGASILGD